MPESLLEEDSFAVVEVMGHNVFAGKVREVVVGGTAFIRVDVPELPERKEKRLYRDGFTLYPAIPGFTKLIGAGSIYAITPCTEEVARRVAESKRATPLTILDVQSPRLLGSTDEEETDEVPY